LFSFKKKKAKVTVDGKTYDYDSVWIAPTMKGKFYGGGMMVAPEQDRFNKDGTVSTVIFRGKSRLATLVVFPKIFKGEHVKHEKRVKIMTGKTITVEFNEPTALQIDGDTIRNVKSYTVHA
jgi:diacylglycerol kinase family enzyme